MKWFVLLVLACARPLLCEGSVIFISNIQILYYCSQSTIIVSVWNIFCVAEILEGLQVDLTGNFTLNHMISDIRFSICRLCCEFTYFLCSLYKPQLRRSQTWISRVDTVFKDVFLDKSEWCIPNLTHIVALR